MTSALSISRLVNVQVNLAPNGAQTQNISTLLVLGSSPVIDTVERFRSYQSISAVAADFGTTAPEYLAALLYFQQSPQPITLQIGRWANAAVGGLLRCAPLTTAYSAIAAWTAITAGSFAVTVDGTVRTLSALNFAAQTNLNGVASVIQTALSALSAGATVVYDSVFNRFTITSGTTGTASTVSFLTATGSGTDISAALGGLSSSSGAYAAPGIAAETALACVALFDTNYGQGWYAATVIGATDADHVAVGSFIEATTNKHIYGISTQEGGVLSSVSTTDIAYLVQALALKRTVVQYSSSTAYAVCSLLGRILTVNYSANNTVITLMYKQEPGIVPETLNATQITNLEAKNANVFVAYNNSTAIIERGTVASGDFLDVIIGTDWLALNIQTALYNLLYTSNTKIPQTDAGTNMLVTTIEGICSLGVVNGLMAPGVWTTGGFGALSMGDFMPKGFYVYAPPVATQLATDRAARKSVTIQVAVKLAGAIHTINTIINVNR